MFTIGKAMTTLSLVGVLLAAGAAAAADNSQDRATGGREVTRDVHPASDAPCACACKHDGPATHPRSLEDEKELDRLRSQGG